MSDTHCPDVARWYRCCDPEAGAQKETELERARRELKAIVARLDNGGGACCWRRGSRRG
jgi:hypothetical protein